MPTVAELTQYVADSLAALPYPKEAGALIAPMRYGLEAGGKHLRPVLLLATCEAFGTPRDRGVNQALGLEIFHNFTLVHDDVMDRSELRRGKPTVCAKYGDTMAILSGDAMLTLAEMTMATGAGEKLPQVLDTFHRAAMEVYAGQEMDMQFESRMDVTPSEYLRMIMLKTAALVRCATSLGSIIASASEQARRAMDAYAIGLGMAFQLRDDYLDTFGDEKTFGKPIGGDILNAKKTWLLTTALTETDDDSLATLVNRSDMEPAEKIDAVKRVYEDLNLPKKCTDLIEEYSNMAILALDDTGISDEWKEFFTGIARSAQTRSI